MNDRFVSIVIVGARGRMGQTLLRSVLDSEDMTLAGAVDSAESPGIGDDAARLCGLPDSGILLSDELRPPRGSIVVDFSLPGVADDNIARCLDRGVPLVLGTTGITSETRELLRRAGKEIPIVSAANFSVGITLLTQFAAMAARALGPDFDTEIFELHHRHKRDAPSGTALRIGKAIAQATERDFEKAAVRSRDTTETQRTPEEIGLSALRGGDSAGEHTIMFLGTGERLEFTHRASDRAIFAHGALRAARWLVGRPAGLYDMADVLGLPRRS